MHRYRAIADRDASCADPHAVKSGDRIKLNGRSAIWNGYRWVWATNVAVKSGWVPDTLVMEENGYHYAKKDFSEQELTCRIGALFELPDETHGWHLCRATDGKTGWLPISHLTRPSPNKA